MEQAASDSNRICMTALRFEEVKLQASFEGLLPLRREHSRRPGMRHRRAGTWSWWWWSHRQFHWQSCVCHLLNEARNWSVHDIVIKQHNLLSSCRCLTCIVVGNAARTILLALSLRAPFCGCPVGHCSGVISVYVPQSMLFAAALRPSSISTTESTSDSSSTYLLPHLLL